MSTPTDPMAGQNVSEDFLAELNLPTAMPIDQTAVAAANSTYARLQVQSKAALAKLSATQAQLKNAKTDKAKAALTARVAALQASYDALTKSTSAAQNKVYETSGQYEKLLEGQNRDAFLALRTMFNSFGLGQLAGKIFEYAKQGYQGDTIALLLQDTPEYKARFAGNEARIKAGLPVLDPATYLSTEQAYRQVLSAAGLPKGYYDNPADFTKWISNDVSPTEIKDRVDIASAAVTQFDQQAKDQLALFYGVDEKDLVAYALDRTRSLPLLQKQAATAQFAGEAARRGLLTDRARFEGYISQGLSQSQAAQGFQTVSEELPNLNAIAERFGTTFGQVAEEEAVFGTSGASAQKRQQLIGSERGLFAGRQGSSAGGLSAGYRQT